MKVKEALQSQVDQINGGRGIRPLVRFFVMNLILGAGVLFTLERLTPVIGQFWISILLLGFVLFLTTLSCNLSDATLSHSIYCPKCHRNLYDCLKQYSLNSRFSVLRIRLDFMECPYCKVSVEDDV